MYTQEENEESRWVQGISEIQRSERRRKKERRRKWIGRTNPPFGEDGGRGVWRNERSSNANIRGDRDWNNPPIRIVDVNGIMQIRAVGARTEPGTDWQLPHRSLNSIHRVVLWIVNRAFPLPPAWNWNYSREKDGWSRKEDDDRWDSTRNDNAKLARCFGGGGGNRSLISVLKHFLSKGRWIDWDDNDVGKEIWIVIC